MCHWLTAEVTEQDRAEKRTERRRARSPVRQCRRALVLRLLWWLLRALLLLPLALLCLLALLALLRRRLRLRCLRALRRRGQASSCGSSSVERRLLLQQLVHQHELCMARCQPSCRK